MMSKRTKRKFIRIMILLIMGFIKMTIAVFVGWLNSLWLMPIAAAERGYTGAYGGEWLLIIGTGTLTYLLFSMLIEKLLFSPGGDGRAVSAMPQGSQKS